MLTKDELIKLSKIKDFNCCSLGKATGLSITLITRAYHEPIENEIYHYDNLNAKALLKYLNRKRPDLNLDDYIRLINNVNHKRGVSKKPKKVWEFNVGDSFEKIGKIKSINKRGESRTLYLIESFDSDYFVMTKAQLIKKIKEVNKCQN